jgi:heme exporter protein C
MVPGPPAAGAASPRLASFLRLRTAFLGAAGALLLAGTVLSFLWAPSLTQGFSAPVAQRVFYFHLGAGITSYVAFSVVFASSLAYLRTRRPLFDAVAAHAALLALLFALMMLTSGPLWAWAEWGVAWRLEDARLTTYLILALVFVGYFALRGRLTDPSERARTSAIYAAAGYALVPISYFSLFLWQSLHPRVISPGGQGIGGQGAVVLVVAIAGFLLLFLGLLSTRLELGLLEDRIASLQRGVDV